MKGKGVVLFFLFLSALMVSAEYRTWTDKKGNEIEAEYKGMKNGKVVLVGRDGKEYDVNPAFLSDADREFIQEQNSSDSETGNESLNDAAESTDAAKESVAISASEANEVAKKYAEALYSRDFDAWKSLMLDTGGWNSGSFKHRLDDELNVKQTRVKGVHPEDYGYSVRIEMVVSLKDWGSGIVSENEWSYWVQMRPDGKIKYDDLFMEHPIKIAMDWCYQHMLSEKKIDYWGPRRSDREFEETKVSRFGYSDHVDHFAKLKALKDMEGWLLDEGRDYDVTEPKMSCPEAVFKGGKRALRSI